MIPINYHGRDLTVYEDGSIYAEPHTYKGRWSPIPKKGRFLKQFTGLHGYLCAGIGINGKPMQLRVSRIVAQAYLPDYREDLEVDHINGNKQDNRPDNLRMTTRKQNSRAFKSVWGKSVFRGVSLNRKKWRAQIKHNDRTVHLGSYDVEEDAARAFNNKAMELGWPKECQNIIS